MARRFAAILLGLGLAPTLHAAGFTFRGHLEDGGEPAVGVYRLQLSLYADREGRQRLAAPVVVDHVSIKGGRFAIGVDFADVPANAHSGWLEVAVMSADEGDFWPLPEKQPVALKGEICPESWALAGNTGTNPAVNFLGTTDGQPLVLRANDERVGLFEAIPLIGPAGGFTANVLLGSPENLITPGVRGATISGGGVREGNSNPDYLGEAPNRVTHHYGTVGGGFANQAGHTGTVGGGVSNAASMGSTIGGGWRNTSSGMASIVGGGTENVASGDGSTIGGGWWNTASDHTSTVAGGWGNGAGGWSSTVGGGVINMAGEAYSFVGGGYSNLASGDGSAVVGGYRNTASGSTSTVSGGWLNCAGGNFSWAGGRHAKVRPRSDSAIPGTGCGEVESVGTDGDAGTFVWADGQQVNFVSTGPNQFLVRASGGALISGDSTINNPEDNRLRVAGTLRVDALGSAGETQLCRNAGNQLAECSSSARYKSDIVDLALGIATVERLRPVAYRWTGSGTADVGFVAEEVAEIDARLVTRNDDGGIESVKYERLTAVLANALGELRAEKDEQLAELAAENAELRVELAALREQQASMQTGLADLRALIAPALGHQGR
jgi:trimeric autotransporter adhesin